jgi:hypothetical protein
MLEFQGKGSRKHKVITKTEKGEEKATYSILLPTDSSFSSSENVFIPF